MFMENIGEMDYFIWNIRAFLFTKLDWNCLISSIRSAWDIRGVMKWRFSSTVWNMENSRIAVNLDEQFLDEEALLQKAS